MPKRIIVILAAVMALACARAEAWAGKLGDEFPVNTYTTGDQLRPVVAELSGGGFVVVWNSKDQDGAKYSVYGQRYSAKGERRGEEFEVSDHRFFHAPSQGLSSVAGLNDGGFVVAWSSDETGHGDIYARRYSATGRRIGKEFLVNTTTRAPQAETAVAGLGDGGFIVLWSSFRHHGLYFAVHGQRYSAEGARVGEEFLVNAQTTGRRGPAVTALNDGGFVALWISRLQDGSAYGVYGQRFSAAGAQIGQEFLVNTHTLGTQIYPSIAGLGDGGFIATWASYGEDGSLFGVYGQRYSAAGAQVGDEFLVNTHTSRSQLWPSVAALSDGGYVVAWSSLSQDSSEYGVYGQRYSAAGQPSGGNFPVNTYTNNSQTYPSVAPLGAGFVVVWTSDLQDGSGLGVFGQRFR